jgi:3-methyladenine DNA glycosylase/8-oxoguanine DNA glycosylase
VIPAAASLPGLASLPLQRRYRPTGPLDLGATMQPHRHGPHDPCQRVEPDGAHWRTWRTPLGPATLRLAADTSAGEIRAQAWGPGAGWALDGVPALLGADDDWSELAVPRGILSDTRRRLAGLRLSRTGLVFEALVPAILEQLVTSTEAFRSWRQLVTRFGEVAPGPAPEGLRVLPAPSVLRQIPDWEWHRAGLDGRRRRTLLAAAGVARQLDRASTLDADAAMKRLTSLPGVGQWTAAEVVQRSHGAADVISVGDYHLPSAVGFVLTGRARTDDAGMVALLEPFRPHRQRVVRLVEACGVRAPRFGPRMAPRDYRHL